MYGPHNPKNANIKNIRARGCVKIIHHAPSNILRECCKFVSTISPRIKPTAIGATEKPCLRAKKPITPKIKASQTSKSWPWKAYAPMTERPKTIGHNMAVGTSETLATILAAYRPFNNGSCSCYCCS